MPSAIGLDIGSKAIKVVELDREGDEFSLRASGVLGYKSGTIDKITDEREFAEVSGVIAKLFKAAGVSGRDVRIGLPESLTYTRTINLPALTDQEVSAAIKWEAEQYIPIPTKDAIIQHQILERRPEGSAPGVTVLLVAAPRNLVERFINIVQGARLNVVAVETELMSLVRALAPNNQTAVVIDFGARSMDLAIAKNGMLSFSRSIPSAGDTLTRAITQRLGVSEREAEEYKRVYGLSSSQLEGKIRAVIEPMLGGIVDEIKKAIHFYQTEEKGDLPKTIIISGGVAGMPELITYLTGALGTEVQVANPFGKIKVSKDIWPMIAPYAPLYSVAVGLAMR
jgi:type IV pilus assembly protein PilM